MKGGCNDVRLSYMSDKEVVCMSESCAPVSPMSRSRIMVFVFVAKTQCKGIISLALVERRGCDCIQSNSHSDSVCLCLCKENARHFRSKDPQRGANKWFCQTECIYI